MYSKAGLSRVRKNCDYGRNSWIGLLYFMVFVATGIKRDFDYNEKALLVAHELLDNGNKTQIWIAKDAIKELENMVKVEGRRRLISTKTQMDSED